MGEFWQDLRYGSRMLAKNPGFTAVALITLALGIGVNTAIFSMVDSFLLRPLPVTDPNQLTVLAMPKKSGSLNTQFSVADWQDIRTQTTGVFSDITGYQVGLDGLAVNGKSDRFLTNYVTGNYFTALGIKPALGRFILPSEGKTPGADPVLVLSYSYWEARFGKDPHIVGTKVSVDGHPVTIVGVAPKGFHGTFSLLDTQGYLPYGMAMIENYPSDFMTNRTQQNLYLLARLRPGVSLEQAQASLTVVAQRLTQQYPETEKDLSLRVFPERLSRPQPDSGNSLLKVSGLFLLLAALVLVLACVNVGNILLVRATVRQREMAVRAALGAARSRLIRQLLTESLLLALLGGGAGILLGAWASNLVESIQFQTDLPIRMDFGFDWRIFAYALAAALLTGIIVGIVPAIRASSANLNDLLHEGGRTLIAGRHRLRNVLVVAQVAGSLMLLIVAGLFTRSLGEAQRMDLGFDPNNVLNLMMDPNEIGYNEAQGREFYKNILPRVRALPGVESTSLAFAVPLGYIGTADTLKIEGHLPAPGQLAPSSSFNMISPDYFQTMKIPLVRGRTFTDADDQKSPYVAIVNEKMAEEFWPHEDPIGRHFEMFSDSGHHAIQIVGIAKDSRARSLRGPMRPFFYVPLPQNYSSIATLQIRTAAAPDSMIPEVEKEIESVAPQLPVFNVQTMTQGLYTVSGLLVFQVGASLAAALGILGLILAIVGVYGVVSYAASQRTHEIGIRMALGAQPRDILKMILGQGLPIVGIGLVMGLALAFAIARLVGNFLVSVSPTDPFTYVAVSLVLVLVAVAACYIPARRAMRVDPMVALHYE
jgi:predicted permease